VARQLRDPDPVEAEQRLAQVRDTIEILVDGRNIAAAAGEDAPFPILCELASELQDLHRGRRAKALVRFPHGPWEIVVVRRGDRALLSFYGTGTTPEVHAHDLSVPYRALAASIGEASDILIRQLVDLEPSWSEAPWIRRFRAAVESLRSGGTGPSAPAPVLGGILGAGRPATDRAAPGPFALEAAADLGDTGMLAYRGAHAFDLHSLLFSGRLTVRTPGSETSLPSGYLFLAVEGLLHGADVVLGLLDGEGPHRTVSFSDGRSAFNIGWLPERRGVRFVAWDRANGQTVLPEQVVDAEDFVEAVLAAASRMADAVLTRNPEQRRNRRLTDLLTEAAELGDWLADLRAGSVTRRREHRREAPEGVHSSEASAEPHQVRHAGFSCRWEVPVPGLIPGSLRLLGDVITCRTEASAWLIDRASGTVVRTRGEDGPPVVGTAAVPGALMLRHGDGSLACLDLPDGQLRWVARPDRHGAPPGLSAAVLPATGGQAVVIGGGGGRLHAFSTDHARPLWCFETRRATRFRLRRGPRLLYAAADDRSLYALDPATGELVWRYRAPAGLSAAPVLTRGVLVVAAGDGLVPDGRLVGLDPARGKVLWDICPGTALPRPMATYGGDVLVSSRFADGSAVQRIEAKTGTVVWRLELDRLGIDDLSAPVVAGDLALVKTDRGRVVALHAADGAPAWERAPDEEEALDVVENLDLQAERGLVFSATSALDVLAALDGRPLCRVPFQPAADGCFAVTADVGVITAGDDLVTSWDLRRYLALLDP